MPETSVTRPHSVPVEHHPPVEEYLQTIESLAEAVQKADGQERELYAANKDCAGYIFCNPRDYCQSETVAPCHVYISCVIAP